MADEVASPGIIHRHKIRERWDELLDIYGIMLIEHMEGDLDLNTVNSFASAISVLWHAVSTQAIDRSEFKEHVIQYKQFEEYVKEPRLFMESPEKMFELFDVLTKLMDDLKITRD